MNDDKRITQKDVDEAVVRLKPIFGIAPGRYLAALYALAALALAFALLVLPGIGKNGTVYSFRSDPPGAMVVVDGAYRASTPCTVFIEAGDREIRVERRGFRGQTLSVRVGGRLFGSLFLPRRAALELSLEAAGDPLGVLRAGMADYAAWALTGPPAEAYQLPMALSEAALDYTAPGNGARSPAAGLAGAALSYAQHPVSARDALRAVAIADGLSAALTPLSLARLAGTLQTELAEDPALLAVLAAQLPAAARSALEASSLFRSAAGTVTGLPPAPSPSGRTTVAGVELIRLPGGAASVTAPSARPALVRLEPFALAVTETTVAQFARFVAARPEWAPEEAASLAARGLADADYLAGFSLAAPGQPVRRVSRQAAEAYCEWLSAMAPEGWRFALPTEAQWAYAAAAGAAAGPAPAPVLLDAGRTGPADAASIAADAAGFKGMLGNVWEWTADSFSATPAAGIEGRRAFPSADAVVRGGSWANKAVPEDKGVDLSSRGPVAEYACTDYLGFRVALVPAGTPGD